MTYILMFMKDLLFLGLLYTLFRPINSSQLTIDHVFLCICAELHVILSLHCVNPIILK